MYYKSLFFLLFLFLSISVQAQVKLTDSKVNKEAQVGYLEVGSFKYIELNKVHYEGNFHDTSFSLTISDKKNIRRPITLRLGRMRWHLPKEVNGLKLVPDLNTLRLQKTIAEDINIDHLRLEYHYGLESENCDKDLFGHSRSKAFIEFYLSGRVDVETYEINSECHIIERKYEGQMK